MFGLGTIINTAAIILGGLADAAFWTRTVISRKAPDSDGEAPFLGELTEQELKIFQDARAIAGLEAFMEADTPDGTVNTEAYYSDVIVPVFMKKDAPGRE